MPEKMDKEDYKSEREKHLAQINAPNISDQMKAIFIENYFRLERNVDGLSRELYYDLLNKYLALRLKNNQVVYELKMARELLKTHNLLP